VNLAQIPFSGSEIFDSQQKKMNEKVTDSAKKQNVNLRAVKSTGSVDVT